MSLGTILLIILILLLVGAFPSWPHSASWGYFPSGPRNDPDRGAHPFFDGPNIVAPAQPGSEDIS